MKKIILTLSLVVFAAGISNAQWYIGGGIGVKSSSSDLNGYRQFSGTMFTFSPRVGYVINDSFLMGIELNYGYYKSQDLDSELAEYLGFPDLPIFAPSDGSMNSFSIRPYFRYNFVKMGRFAIGAELGLAYTNMKPKNAEESSPDLGIKMNGFSMDISPIVTFAINKHWWIETKLDILGLNYDVMTVKSVNSSDMGKITYNDFNFGFDMDNLLTLGGIKLGVVYRF